MVNQIKDKNGKEIVFEFDLLKLVSDSGRRVKDSSKHYIVQCPLCMESLGYYKSKLYITKDYSTGWCHRCETTFKTPEAKRIDTISKYTISRRLVAPKLCFNKPKLSLIRCSDLSYYYDSSEYMEDNINYVLSRNTGLTHEVVNKLKLRYRPNQVILPVIYNDELIHYQIRYINPIFGSYFHPEIDKKGIGIINTNNNTSRKYIIAEGYFSALAAHMLYPEYIGIWSMGKYYTEYQVELLYNLIPEKILVYLDETKYSVRLIETLKSSGKFMSNMEYIPSSGEDPEECLNRLYSKALSAV